MNEESLTPDWMPELFFCHRHRFAYVAYNIGFRIGTRADQFDTNRTQKTLDADIPVSFVDNNFKDPDRNRLREIVDTVDAEFVVLPDVYSVEDLDSVLSFGDELATQFNATPIVVPKCDLTFSDIPDSWLVGFSVPSGYADTEIPLSSFGDHKIHLLGGTHMNQIKYANEARELGIDVFSLDGNAFSKASSFGKIMNEPIEILDENGELDERTWVSDVDGYTDWGQRICQSLARYYELWRQWSIKVGRAPPDVGLESNI
jgi:hypothetical protein